MTPQWKQLLDHVMSIPEQVYEHWNSTDGWDNQTRFGQQYGEDGVSWCVIFDWDMYADVGLAAIVPKVDNVSVFTDWAKARGQWSEYPSIGAWVNFGNGSHTEIVVGFDATNVYTKGGNSVQAGSTDAGQGNGVWSHTTARQSPRVVGYFAPRFPDGQCPPTADPNDPRGGRAQAAYRWPGPDPAPTTAPATAPTQEDDLPYSEADLSRIISNAVPGPASADRVAYADAYLLAYALAGEAPPGANDDLKNLCSWFHQAFQSCVAAVVDNRLAAVPQPDVASTVTAAVQAAVGPAVAAALAGGIQLTVTPSPKGN